MKKGATVVLFLALGLFGAVAAASASKRAPLVYQLRLWLNYNHQGDDVVEAFLSEVQGLGTVDNMVFGDVLQFDWTTTQPTALQALLSRYDFELLKEATLD